MSESRGREGEWETERLRAIRVDDDGLRSVSFVPSVPLFSVFRAFQRAVFSWFVFLSFFAGSRQKFPAAACVA